MIWCPKYRRKVLVGDVEKRLRELLFKKAEEIGVSIETLEILPDHLALVHQGIADGKSALDCPATKRIFKSRTTEGVRLVENKDANVLDA